jgi:hypothetical protein
MLKFYKIAFLFILAFGLNISSNAQITKKAQVGFRFLENPVSAEVVGRGETGTTTTYNSNGIFWNPALIGRIKTTADISLNYTNGIADINYNAGAATYRVGNFGVVGVSLLSMDYGTFYGTRRAVNDNGYVETGEFSPTAYSAGITFAQEVNDRFSYGVTLKYAYQNLGSAWVAPEGGDIADASLAISQKKYKTGGLAADVGAHYDFQYHGFLFAAVLQNISREFNYEGEKFPMPFSINFGFSMEPLSFFDGLLGNDHKFVLDLESRHPRDFEQKFKIGGEYSFMNTFFARAGYMQGYDERGLTAGLGINYKVSDVPLRIDYAYLPFGIFGGVHFLSLSISYK